MAMGNPLKMEALIGKSSTQIYIYICMGIIDHNPHVDRLHPNLHLPIIHPKLSFFIFAQKMGREKIDPCPCDVHFLVVSIFESQ